MSDFSSSSWSPWAEMLPNKGVELRSGLVTCARHRVVEDMKMKGIRVPGIDCQASRMMSNA